MCQRCEDAEKELTEYITNHKHGEASCPVPRADSDFRQTTFWLLALAHARMTITLDRMDTSKAMFDDAERIPAEVLTEWETHVMAAAEMFGRARARRERR